MQRSDVCEKAAWEADQTGKVADKKMCRTMLWPSYKSRILRAVERGGAKTGSQVQSHAH
jgi:hypothetical protein